MILSLSACISGKKTFYVPSNTNDQAKIMFKTSEVGIAEVENQLNENSCDQLQRVRFMRNYQLWGGKSTIVNPQNVVPMSQELTIPAENPIYFAQGIFFKQGKLFEGRSSCALLGQFTPKKDRTYLIEYVKDLNFLKKSTCQVKIYENGKELQPHELEDIKFKRCPDLKFL